MSLKLFYITNRPDVAKIAEEAGVDRVFIDMEYIGKQARQGGMDTVQNRHTIDDIRRIREVLKKSELLVRVNPIHDESEEYSSSEEEIDGAITAGADVVMLPMYHTPEEVERFIACVNGRAKVMLLCETPEASERMSEIIEIKGIDEIHIGLNDLHLALGKSFMFELLADGTVDKMAQMIKKKGIPFGFGGIARVGYGVLPAEKIIAEHYRIGSTMAILSRSFCNADKMTDTNEIRDLFIDEVKKIREKESEYLHFSEMQYEQNRNEVKFLTQQIVKQISKR